MDDKCAICLGQLREDAVMTLCPGQHCFCFGCICDYYSAKKTESVPCPTCRQGDGKVVPSKALVRQLKSTGKEVTVPDEENRLKQYTDHLSSLRDIFPSHFMVTTNDCIITPIQISIFSRYKNHKIPPTRNGTSKTRGQIVNSARFFIAVSVKFSTDMVCANTHDDYESAKNETMLGDFDLSFFVASDEDEYIVLYQHYPTIIHMASPIRDYVEAIFQDGISDMIDHIMEMVGVLTTEEDIAMAQSNSIL